MWELLPHQRRTIERLAGRFRDDPEVATRGPEPARYAFVDARLVFSRSEGLETLLGTIPHYPEAEREQKLAGFAAQLPVHRSYLELGEYSRNPWLLAETAVEIVLFGGRLILAHNRRLYPGRKHFLREIERVPEKPEGMLELAGDLLTRPSIALASHFCELVLAFRDWPQAPEGAWQHCRHDRELHWRYGPAPLADC